MHEYDIGASRWCFNCLEKGTLLMRTFTTELGSYTTFCFINWCNNPLCFRYIKEKPDGWVHTTMKFYDKDKVHINRDSRKPVKQSDTEAQNDGKTTLDRRSKKVRGLEEFRIETMFGLSKRPQPVRLSDEEYAGARQAISHIEGYESSDGPTDLLEG